MSNHQRNPYQGDDSDPVAALSAFALSGQAKQRVLHSHHSFRLICGRVAEADTLSVNKIITLFLQIYPDRLVLLWRLYRDVFVHYLKSYYLTRLWVLSKLSFALPQLNSASRLLVTSIERYFSDRSLGTVHCVGSAK